MMNPESIDELLGMLGKPRGSSERDNGQRGQSRADGNYNNSSHFFVGSQPLQPSLAQWGSGNSIGESLQS
jgi:hypothetical protein